MRNRGRIRLVIRSKRQRAHALFTSVLFLKSSIADMGVILIKAFIQYWVAVAVLTEAQFFSFIAKCFTFFGDDETEDEDV